MRARWPRRRRRPPAEPELAAALLEHVSEPLVACDAEGRIVVVNEPARRLQGEADEGCSAYLPGAVVPLPDDQMPLWRALRGEQVRDVALDVQPRGAARRSLNVSGWPVRGRGGRLLGAIVVMRESADDPERRLPAAILDHIGEAVGLVRASDGVLVYVNTTWERMF